VRSTVPVGGGRSPLAFGNIAHALMRILIVNFFMIVAVPLVGCMPSKVVRDRASASEVQTFASPLATNGGTLEWLVGRWDCIEREGTGILMLDRMERFCVYPYLDYKTLATSGPVEIAAEFQFRDRDGKLREGPGEQPIVLDRGRLMAGIGQVAFFDFTNGVSAKKRWIRLRLLSKECPYLLTFEKGDDDPGQPLNRRFMFSYSGVLIEEDAAEYEKSYRDSLRSKKGNGGSP
jgi:hypothetical protein